MKAGWYGGTWCTEYQFCDNIWDNDQMRKTCSFTTVTFYYHYFRFWDWSYSYHSSVWYFCWSQLYKHSPSGPLGEPAPLDFLSSSWFSKRSHFGLQQLDMLPHWSWGRDLAYHLLLLSGWRTQANCISTSLIVTRGQLGSSWCKYLAATTKSMLTVVYQWPTLKCL